MAEIKRRIEDAIINARRNRLKEDLLVLTFAKDQILECEKSLFKTMTNATAAELTARRKRLELKEEASVLKHIIDSYNDELIALRKMKITAKEQLLARTKKMDLLGNFLSDLRDPNLEDTLLEMCVTNNFEAGKVSDAMQLASTLYPFEDLRIVRTIILRILS